MIVFVATPAVGRRGAGAGDGAGAGLLRERDRRSMLSVVTVLPLASWIVAVSTRVAPEVRLAVDAGEHDLRRSAVHEHVGLIETTLPTLSVPGQDVAVAADGAAFWRGRADDRRRAAAVGAAGVVGVRGRVARQRATRRGPDAAAPRVSVQSVRDADRDKLAVRARSSSPPAEAATPFTVSAPPAGAVVSLRSVSVAVAELFPAASVALRSTVGSSSCRRSRRRGSSRTGRLAWRRDRPGRVRPSGRRAAERARRRRSRPRAAVGDRVPDPAAARPARPGKRGWCRSGTRCRRARRL